MLYRMKTCTPHPQKKIKLKRIHIAILCFVPSLSVGFEDREQNVKTFQMPFLAP